MLACCAPQERLCLSDARSALRSTATARCVCRRWRVGCAALLHVQPRQALGPAQETARAALACIDRALRSTPARRAGGRSAGARAPGPDPNQGPIMWHPNPAARRSAAAGAAASSDGGLTDSDASCAGRTVSHFLAHQAPAAGPLPNAFRARAPPPPSQARAAARPGPSLLLAACGEL